jgi:hypothetical protein
MRIPAAERAIIPFEKLADYLLDIDHPDGGPKARLFAAVAGFSADRPEEFERALRQHLTREAQSGKASPFGQKYEITGPLEGPEGSVRVTSVWIIRYGEETPRLITVVPKDKP